LICTVEANGSVGVTTQKAVSPNPDIEVVDRSDPLHRLEHVELCPLADIP